MCVVLAAKPKIKKSFIYRVFPTPHGAKSLLNFDFQKSEFLVVSGVNRRNCLIIRGCCHFMPCRLLWHQFEGNAVRTDNYLYIFFTMSCISLGYTDEVLLEVSPYRSCLLYSINMKGWYYKWHLVLTLMEL